MLDGIDNSNLDLVCAPGVVVDGSGRWHLYFVAANRTAPLNTYLYVATASAPGVTWSVPQLVRGVPQGTGYLETPTPFWLNGKIVLYYVGTDASLHRAVSSDGVTFGASTRAVTATLMSHGRVTIANNIFYLVSSRNPIDVALPPDEIDLATSTEGLHFGASTVLLSTPGDPRPFSPFAVVSGTTLTLYYASSAGTPYAFWESDSGIYAAQTSVPPIHLLSVSVVGKDA